MAGVSFFVYSCGFGIFFFVFVFVFVGFLFLFLVFFTTMNITCSLQLQENLVLLVINYLIYCAIASYKQLISKIILFTLTMIHHYPHLYKHGSTRQCTYYGIFSPCQRKMCRRGRNSKCAMSLGTSVMIPTQFCHPK